jgi:hypothetical protein
LLLDWCDRSISHSSKNLYLQPSNEALVARL